MTGQWIQLISHPIYILACVLIGLFGTGRRGGFIGFTLISILLTPLTSIFILLVGAQRKTPEDD
jgi:hypothetical protein